MYYLGLILIGWMIVGIFYWIYMVWVTDGFVFLNENKDVQEPIEYGANELYYYFLDNKLNFLIACILFGTLLAIGDLRFYISYIWRKFK